MAKNKQKADVNIKKPKEKKSKLKPIKAYSEGYKQEKVTAFITKAAGLRNLFALWRTAVGGVIIMLLGRFKSVSAMPQGAQILLLVAFLTMGIPAYMLIKHTRKCPVCENKIGKILGLFPKRCPYCRTDLDPENQVVVFK